MFWFFFIVTWLIGQGSVLAADCTADRRIVVTYPRSGIRTYGDAISLRGFLCQNYPLIVVRNITTKKSMLTETREVCEDGQCVYPFAAFVEDLAPGTNELQAIIPGRSPPLSVSIQVIRTVLADLDSVSESGLTLRRSSPSSPALPYNEYRGRSPDGPPDA